MFSLDENFVSEIFYLGCIDFYFKIFFYFFGILFFLEGVRSQISEIDLLQLAPGSYFFLCFCSFLVFFFQSEMLNRIPFQGDFIRGTGTKTKNKKELFLLLKIVFFLISNVFLLSLNTILPLSLDYFKNSGEKTLQNFWSLTQVIELESFIFSLLISFSQIPLYFILNWNTPKTIKKVSKIWKILLFTMTIVAGVLTPTLDGSTQLSFVCFTLSFYLFLLNWLQKKRNIKSNQFFFFGS
jgi:hypothetical protein